jgi:hypothetical protein
MLDALNAGGKRAVRMTDPNGTLRYVPEDQVNDATQAGGKVYQDPPQFWSDPKGYLQNAAQQMGQEAQRQNDLAMGVESQGKSLVSRLGHSLYSLVPATGEFAAKVGSGLVGNDAQTWTNAAMLAAGAVDPAIPGAYFSTQGTAQLTGLTPGVKAGNTSPENVQNALLAASSVAGGATSASAPNSGAALNAGPPIVRGLAKGTNTVLSKAPEYVLGGAGAAVGGYLAGGTGAGIGGTLGAIAGKVLPDVEIPGEEFGLPKKVPPNKTPATPKTVSQPVAEQPAESTTPDAQTGTPVAAGNLPLPKGNPYAGPRIPAVMEPVVSGQINKIGYHPESQTAVIEFRNGSVYDYRGVPPEIYQGLKDSESAGSFFSNNLKGRYKTSKLGTVQPVKAQANVAPSQVQAQPPDAPADAMHMVYRYIGLE